MKKTSTSIGVSNEISHKTETISLMIITLLLFIVPLEAQTVWTGETDTNWATASNWSTAAVPLATDEVIIPNTEEDPVIMANTAAVAKSVYIQTGGILTINAMGSLTINGATYQGIFNEGTVNNDGTITIGSLGYVGYQGVLNNGSFNNNTNGEIGIDSARIGISNISGNIINSGKITIGSIGNLTTNGLYNEASFTNNIGGEVYIDRTGGTGIYNLPNSDLTNDGLIAIGQTHIVRGPAIYNFATFQNNTGAEVLIEHTQRSGIDHRDDGVFTNEGKISIGLTSEVTNSGIFNTGEFNNTGGEINIDSTDTSVNNRRDALFTNTGKISIGTNLGPKAYCTFYNEGTFTNDAAGEISIDRALKGSALFNESNGLFTNKGSLAIGSQHDIGDQGLFNEGTFNNQASGEITIDRLSISDYSSNGIYNRETFTNAGKITIGNLGSAGKYGLFNHGDSFVNSGEIRINQVKLDDNSHGLRNNSGTFTNTGKIIIGDVASGAYWGMWNESEFNNNSGGEITINNAIIEGFRNDYYGTLTNDGKLTIGSTSTTGEWGLWNEATINNNNSGEISIDNSSITGLRNSYGTITNSGKLNIGGTATVGEWALWNNATINNDAGGQINIDRASSVGVINETGTLSNDGEINIGASASVGLYAIWNEATFENNACASCSIYSAFSNSSTFTNEGLFLVNTTEEHINDDGFNNDGVISYPQNNPIPNVTNNDIIVAPISVECNTFTPALELGDINSFTIGSTWYFDETQTTQAGTYDQGTNTFTITNWEAGDTHILYFSAYDDGNACTHKVSIEVTLTDDVNPTISCPDLQNLTLEANCEATLPDYISLATTDDNCVVASVNQTPIAGTLVSNAGEMMVELTVTDLKGLATSCSFTINKVDDTPPSALCKDATVQLDDNGDGSITVEDIDAGSTDACGLSSTFPPSLDMTSFNCAHVGSNTVTLTVTDINNNANTCTASVTVQDNVLPAITICQGTTIDLNGETEVSSASIIDFEASDACGIASITYNPEYISCDQLGSSVPVTITTTDNNGNPSSCVTNVMVEGQPCGWGDFGEDGIGCEGSNGVSYDVPSETFTLESDGCYTTNFNQDNAAYTKAELCGDGEIMAHITSINPLGQGWAGITMRESEAPGAKKVELLVNLRNFIRRSARSTTNGVAYPAQFYRPQATWLRIVRTGNQFVGYASTNGTYWQTVMTSNIPMNACIHAGLVVTNYNNNNVTATFDNVEVTQSGISPFSIPEIGTREVDMQHFIAKDFTIFPNPAKEKLSLNLENYFGQEVQILISNQLEQPILERKVEQVGSIPEEFELNSLSSGTYFVRIITAKGQKVKQFVIVK
ncbi:MAG: hypothetical protein DHS20C18_55310 [Saprospiraceae bacterium]|nr:MAG: hypothetical protein DHS20C18_55310 [Saprospiraceae bacterium]